MKWFLYVVFGLLALELLFIVSVIAFLLFDEIKNSLRGKPSVW